MILWAVWRIVRLCFRENHRCAFTPMCNGCLQLNDGSGKNLALAYTRLKNIGISHYGTT